MSKPENNAALGKNTEFPHLNDLENYTGRAERIYGFKRIKEAIGDIQTVNTVEPIILLENLYSDWEKQGVTDPLVKNVGHIWKALEGEANPLIVRRLFPDENGEAQDGPRSGNVNSQETLLSEVVNFFEYFKLHYHGKDVLPEIMVHRLVDASNPPLKKEPFLPFASGDVIPLSSHRFSVRATFGADESVQGFPADSWEVTFEAGGHVNVIQKNIDKKDHSVIPAEGEYKVIDIPSQFQDVPAMRFDQIVNIAEVCKRLNAKDGPHRLEFDGTVKNGFNVLSVIEAAPYQIRKNTPDVINRFIKDGQESSMPVQVMSSPKDLAKIMSLKDRAVAYVDPSFFQGNEQRIFLTLMASQAKEQGLQLVVLSSGNIATQHAVRVLMDNGNIVLFVESENFNNQEPVRIYPVRKEGVIVDVGWERENPYVFMDRMQGRDVSRIGRKARGLRELQRHGFDVPNWGAIETSQFRRLLNQVDPDSIIASLDNTFDSEVIKKQTFPIQQAIDSYNHDFLGGIGDLLAKIGGNRWSVRSSSTSEDNQGSSFAGVFKTLLNISAEGITPAVKEVIKSALAPEAFMLAQASKIKPSEMSMAIIIQKMVNAKSAGTIFTIDASARNRDAIRIEATAGLGEELVDGTAKSHLSLQIDRLTGGVLKSNTVSEETPILTLNQIKTLRDIGLEIETKFQEGPQDIEWAIDHNDKIWLLQARPLTDIK